MKLASFRGGFGTKLLGKAAAEATYNFSSDRFAYAPEAIRKADPPSADGCGPSWAYRKHAVKTNKRRPSCAELHELNGISPFLSKQIPQSTPAFWLLLLLWPISRGVSDLGALFHNLI